MSDKEAETSGHRPSVDKENEKPTDTSRRRAMTAFMAGGSAVYAAALLIPAYRFLDQPRKATDGEGNFRRVIRLDALAEGKPLKFNVTGDQRDAYTLSRAQTLGSVWLQRDGDAVTALSAECPHLGCAINVGPSGDDFRCPCHTSKFLPDGSAASGPSPRPMDSLSTRVVDGWVEVDFARYRQGVPTKERIA